MFYVPSILSFRLPKVHRRRHSTVQTWRYENRYVSQICILINNCALFQIEQIFKYLVFYRIYLQCHT